MTWNSCNYHNDDRKDITHPLIKILMKNVVEEYFNMLKKYLMTYEKNFRFVFFILLEHQIKSYSIKRMEKKRQ